MESATEGIFIIDAGKQCLPVIYANQAFLKMTGYAKDQIIGHSYSLYNRTDIKSRFAEKMKQTIERRKVLQDELLIITKDNKKLWVLLRIAPVCDTNGAITNYVGVQTDITTMKQEELVISTQREELLHVTRVGMLAEFVSSLAHEINQPLTAILSYTQAAQRMLTGNSEVQKILAYIIKDAMRAANVIERLRALLKHSKPEMKPLDINLLIKRTIALVATDAIVKNISIKLELKKDLPMVLGDRIQLQQVLLNLISNSFYALSGNTGSRDVLISASRKSASMVAVRVKDSGSGINEKNMKKLFTHFFTSKPDGLGMGLSISRSIVEMHGGQLNAKNNPDRGAAFVFTVPVHVKDAQ
jgi:two-component system sensor kinase FixL